MISVEIRNVSVWMGGAGREGGKGSRVAGIGGASAGVAWAVARCTGCVSCTLSCSSRCVSSRLWNSGRVSRHQEACVCMCVFTTGMEGWWCFDGGSPIPSDPNPETPAGQLRPIPGKSRRTPDIRIILPLSISVVGASDPSIPQSKPPISTESTLHLSPPYVIFSSVPLGKQAEERQRRGRASPPLLHLDLDLDLDLSSPSLIRYKETKATPTLLVVVVVVDDSVRRVPWAGSQHAWAEQGGACCGGKGKACLDEGG